MNPNFLMELMINSPNILRIGKLNFSEELFGRIFYPDLYKEIVEEQKKKSEMVEDKDEQHNPDSRLSSVPEETRKEMINLANL